MLLSPEKEQVKEVFISGGFPTKTYVKRKQLENTLQNFVNTNRLITITGVTKSGKTVLTQSFFPEDQAIRINAGELSDQDDFWQILCSKCGDEVLSKCRYKTVSTSNKQNDGSVGVSWSFIDMKKSKNEGETNTVETCLEIPIKRAVSDYFSSHVKDKAVIIDDFHYLNEDLKREIIRFFKSHIHNGLNLVLISIPHRSHEAVAVEKEMQGRVCPVQVEGWSKEELIQIAKIGFGMLGKEVEGHILDQFAQEAYGSPHLMQAFCLDLSLLLIDSGSYSGVSMLIPTEAQVEEVFRRVANQVGRTTFSKMVKGLSGEGRRKERLLKDGRKVDIYGLVAHTFTVLRPGMASIRIFDFVKTARQQCSEAPPLRHEITRVLQGISKVAVCDSSSNPVIDLDVDNEGLIHITDPFFPFYLEWGDCSIT